jgi:hypothetical protein
MISSIQFILGYTIFLFFIIFIGTMGAPSFIPADKQAQLQAITLPSQVKIDLACGGIDILCWLKTLASICYNFFYLVWQGASVFYLLMSVNSTFKWITTLIILPYTITLFYIVIKLFAIGGGGA